ncbi:hypothetical protein L226DRAFT_456313 [Lentinus tigrinus ALCF2SS1-7]|uniref:Lanthionine synthetase C family protein n=1 Tax=Lentinus tigrinus ALCF2SS1-6 TaxID=1328759 RepID=A0A5C2SPB5_9APHY|nr:hypothetical protein L227DRAFT_493792 [Lentinus tigrinus ALCF2SS1-6]RPD79426.1 hypothetical protein L226DRAFT_456313 [Lentinus tigrinus ALCF2SS1-7]
MDIHAFAVLPLKTFPYTPTSALIAVPFHAPQHGNHLSYLETSVGPATLLLVRQLRLHQNPESTAHKHARRGKLDGEMLEEVELAETWRGAVDLISGAQEVATMEMVDDDGCEVLYGRAGLLYALLLLRSELAITLDYLSHAAEQKERVVREIEKLCSNDNIKALVDDIIQRGQAGAKLYADDLEESERPQAPPLMWRWHETRYLGAAHGLVGILQVLLHAPSAILEPHWEDITTTIEWLLAIQDPLGNWPTKAGRHMPYVSGGAAVQGESKRVGVSEEHDDPPIQWCHGATGFLILFSALLRRSIASPGACPLSTDLHASVVSAMSRAGELVYTRGLLRKGTGLCHGVGGTVYALLAVSDALDALDTHEASASHTGLRPHSHSISHSLSLKRTVSHSHPIPHEVRDPEHAYWLQRAVHLADLATGYQKLTLDGKMKTPDHPYSLYEGVAGMCCAWSEVMMRLGDGPGTGGGNGNGNGNGNASWSTALRRGMPGYDDIALLP